jgi:exonuclease SbcC
MEGKDIKASYFSLLKEKRQEAYLYVENENGGIHLTPTASSKPTTALLKTYSAHPSFSSPRFSLSKLEIPSEYTKGELKEILTELLGLEKLKAISDKAKEVKKGLQTIIQIKQQENAALLKKPKGNLKFHNSWPLQKQKLKHSTIS